MRIKGKTPPVFLEGARAFMNRNEREGMKKNVRGRAKQAAGILTGNKNLESAGARERAAGATRERIGSASRKVLEAIEDLGRKIQK